jgi:hypothetical protein
MSWEFASQLNEEAGYVRCLCPTSNNYTSGMASLLPDAGQFQGCGIRMIKSLLS